MNSRYREKDNDIPTRIGERIIGFFIGKYTKIRYRMWMLRKEANEGELNLQDLSRICSKHVVPVTSPLVLISEIQGSGGPLVSRLFDGHPELHVHPHELMIGSTETGMWPRINLSDGPERWFEVLFEDIVSEYNREGYTKEKEHKETFPFVFISSLQKEIFLNYFNSVKSITLRGIFDAYMTSYFGAWLNNQNYHGSKKFITAHTPRLGIIKENTESFFEVYPDGRHICVLRDPKTWFPSARKRWPGRYADVGQALSEWNESAEAMLWNKKEFGDSVCLVRYEDIVRQTEAVMRFLTEFLGIEFDDILLAPTFNKFPINANMDCKEDDRDIVNGRILKERTLMEEATNTIEKITAEIYSQVQKEVVKFE